MNRDDILRMALEAGFHDSEGNDPPKTFNDEITVEEYSVGNRVERFANLVAAAERKKCYDIAMNEASSGSLYGWPECAYYIAKAIRERGDK